jgi:hypothetical protein
MDSPEEVKIFPYICGNSSIHRALRTSAIRIFDLRWIACNLILSANILNVFLFILVVSDMYNAVVVLKLVTLCQAGPEHAKRLTVSLKSVRVSF